MQNHFNILILSFFLFVIISPAQGESPSFSLIKADSLFQEKKYTEAWELFQEIYQQGYYSPNMLLKMAFIQEGLKHPGPSLFFLNLYYLQTRDAETLEKIKDLASRNGLSGYESKSLISYYHHFHPQISILGSSLLGFLFFLTWYLNKNSEKKHFTPFITSLLLSILLSGHLYLGSNLNTAIITSPRTFIMKGPSPGAEMVSMVTEGHRITILGQHDVWLKIKWEGETRYIHKNAVKKLEI